MLAIDPLILPAPRFAELKAHLMLFYTGIARTASDVASSYVGNLEARRRQLRIMKELVDECIDIPTVPAGNVVSGALIEVALGVGSARLLSGSSPTPGGTPQRLL